MVKYRSSRLSLAAVATAASSAAVLIAAPTGSQASGVEDRPIPSVVVYGDSLAVEAQEYFHLYFSGHLAPVIEAVSGTSPCDHIDNMRERVERGERPATVVFAFVGNGDEVSPCVKAEPRNSQPIGAVYASDLVAAADVWMRVGVPVAFVAGPPVVLAPGHEEVVDRVRAVRDATTATAAAVGAQLIDVAPWFTRDGVAVTSAPCRHWDGCSGDVVIRSADGLHFCPTGGSPDPSYQGNTLKLLRTSLCRSQTAARAIYSAGAHRYGRAIALAVVRATSRGQASALGHWVHVG